MFTWMAKNMWEMKYDVCVLVPGQFSVENTLTMYGSVEWPKTYVCESNSVYFWPLRVCQVTKEIKEMLAFLVHRYFFFSVTLLPRTEAWSFWHQLWPWQGWPLMTFACVHWPIWKVTLIETGQIYFSEGNFWVLVLCHKWDPFETMALFGGCGLS